MASCVVALSLISCIASAAQKKKKVTQPADPVYFDQLSKGLKSANIHVPTLVIDQDALDHNLAQLQKTIVGQGYHHRIAAKSLPSLPLLKYIAAKMKTNRYMVFHIPFLKLMAEEVPDADILIGKPLPTQGLAAFYEWYAQYKKQSNGKKVFDPAKQLQWLVDSDERLIQYEEFARQHNIVLGISLEVDIGLHRGGYRNTNDGERHFFVQSVKRLMNSRNLEFKGMMGYEAHVTKIPPIIGGPTGAFNRAQESYKDFVRIAQVTYGSKDAFEKLDLCLNAAGSTTYPLYNKNNNCATELTTASALVMPTDFDTYTLASHKPASFIATPVLKVMKNGAEIPMVATVSSILRSIGALARKTVFIYGGYWLAEPYYPPRMEHCDVLGHSTNQEQYTVPVESKLGLDDFVYFRPTQSEFVFLQFGKLAVVRKGKLVDTWDVFTQEKN